MIVREIDGFTMYLKPADGGICNALARRGGREPCFMWILRTEAAGPLALDIGANIGYTTLHLCRHAEYVIAVEPDPRSRPLLIRNIEANRYAHKTTIHDFAVSDTAGKQRFTLAQSPNLSSLGRPADAGADIITAPTRTIDSLDLDPAFIKMDIEGGEVRALRGAMASLQRSRRCKLLIEVHPTLYRGNEFTEVLRDLVQMGYRFRYVVSAGVPRPDLFQRRGYRPLRRAPHGRRAVYDCVSTQDAIEWACRPIEQKCPNGRISHKIVRAVLLVKE